MSRSMLPFSRRLLMLWPTSDPQRTRNLAAPRDLARSGLPQAVQLIGPRFREDGPTHAGLHRRGASSEKSAARKRLVSGVNAESR